MVEGRRRPTCCIVAAGTIARGKCRPCGGVHRIVGLLPGCQVALRIAAIGRSDRQIVVAVDMAESASYIRVPIGEQEASGAMVELGVQPIVKRMAVRTV